MDITKYNNLLRLSASLRRFSNTDGKKYREGGELDNNPDKPEEFEVTDQTDKQEYLDWKARKIREASHKNSMDRKIPSAPNIGTMDNPILGKTCLYTALDNYKLAGSRAGKVNGRIISGNAEFASKAQDAGYVPIDNQSEWLPGDIIQHGTGHAITFHGYNQKGKPVYNYSKGSGGDNAFLEGNIVKEGLYPVKNPGKELKGYRYVGTPAEQKEWGVEWATKRREYLRKNPVQPLQPLPVPYPIPRKNE